MADPSGDQGTDFYEDDEPLEELRARFERGPKAVSAPPAATGTRGGQAVVTVTSGAQLLGQDLETWMGPLRRVERTSSPLWRSTAHG